MVAACSSHSEGVRERWWRRRAGDCERAGATNDELPESYGGTQTSPGGSDDVDIPGPSSDVAGTVPEGTMADFRRSDICRAFPAVYCY
jgi:hypothetical protein